MRKIVFPAKESWGPLVKRPEIETAFLDSTVSNILARVRQSGDEALKALTLELDKVQLKNIRVEPEEFNQAIESVPATLKSAITQAAFNIRKFHESQRQPLVKIETMPGVICWREVRAIEKIGIYIPGGSAPLFSTALMLCIPAVIAGCIEVSICTPPAADGTINPAILFAANHVGIKTIYKVGGAQAIAALAYGTHTIRAVDKIFGPGNQFVTKAKQMVSNQGIAIDLLAGPSEVMIIADENANPDFVASDLLAQAEHGHDSQVILLATKGEVIDAVLQKISSQLDGLPRKSIVAEALTHSYGIVLKDMTEIIEFANLYAPEHLIINTKNAAELARDINHAGSVFLGPYSPESAGDYASGTNHTLPTSGFARSTGGVSLESFQKYITFQQINEEGIKSLGPVVELMAEAEQLEGHKKSISLRLEFLTK